MAASTPALAALHRAGVEFKTHRYELVESDLSYGEAVAAALGVDPGRLFKTLVAECDAKPVVAIVPVRSQLSLKALARAATGKKAQMADPVDAEKWTGYVVGGISPFAQKRRLPAFLDDSAVGFETIYVSAGLRGLQVELDPTDLITLLDCRLAALAD
ncbi:MAG TPA: Cys-tRNA(Pro) deacylase [Acidimicrobiia bacterium]|nr:Cys-tRNA(Pro) deacylase [Acidimicrobiia bacterium]